MEKGLMPLRNAARKYKLPLDWLTQQARNGSLPCLIAGDQILFDEVTLVKELTRKAREGFAHAG